MDNYPNPCDTCTKDGSCWKGYGCPRWREYYRHRQQLINDYPKKKKQGRFDTRFVYQHPNDTRRYLLQWPCNGCEREAKCDIPCGAYLAWYDGRMAYFRSMLEEDL